MEDKDPKAWVRQRLAIMMGGLVIACFVGYFLLQFYGRPMDLVTFLEVLALPGGCVLWFFGSREVEKAKTNSEVVQVAKEAIAKLAEVTKWNGSNTTGA